MFRARETDRLRLAPWSVPLHTAALAGVNADPEVMRFIGRGDVLDAAQTGLQSRAFAAHWARFGFGLWAATAKDADEIIGFVGLAHPLWLPGYETAVEVGWRLRRDAWGRGFATEGARAALHAGFGELATSEIVSLIHPGNLASVAVARKLGLTLRAELTNPRSGAALHVYSISAGGGPSAPGRRGAIGSPGGPT